MVAHVADRREFWRGATGSDAVVRPAVRPAPHYREQESSRRQEGPEAGFDHAPAAGDYAEIAVAGEAQDDLDHRASDDRD